jgi:hypothetical protein
MKTSPGGFNPDEVLWGFNPIYTTTESSESLSFFASLKQIPNFGLKVQ